MSLDPRMAAYRILADVRDGQFADHSAARHLAAVSARDRGLAQEIAYGVLRLQARLDTLLAEFTDRPLDRIDAPVLDWARIGLYQLRELRVPDHAAVGETMRNARRSMDRPRAGFLNAVLRAAARSPSTDPFPSRDDDPSGYLTSYGSHPAWLIGRWLDRWGWHQTLRTVQHGNRPPGVYVRFPSAPDPEALASSGHEFDPVPGAPRSRRLVSGTPAEVLADFPGAVIQDPAASAVVDFTGASLPGPVYEACAAPGTKTRGWSGAALTGETYVAADISPRRIGLASSVLADAPVHLAVMDARQPAVDGAGTVLIDTPCTGTGVLARRPELRWKLGQARLDALVALQAQILDGAASTLEPGGLLVYATCSLEPEENGRQVDQFLERHTGFEREPFPLPDLPETWLDERGDLAIHPGLTGLDGAYAARLRKRT